MTSRVCATVLILCSIALPASAKSKPASALDFIVGTWTGTSTCVGNRPACKNETVVYRFAPIEGHPNQVQQLADMIIGGKRVPMGALVFDVDQQHHTVRNEFTIGRTHGVWTYTASADSIVGTLVILPAEDMARDVRVHRAKESEVPKAPPLSDYND